jgi:hypothetical protein
MAIGIIINGTDRSGYLDKTEGGGKGGQSQHQVTKAQRGTMTLVLRIHPNDSWPGPTVGQPVGVYNQLGQRDFGGLIGQMVLMFEGNTQESCWVLQCDSFERMLDRHTVPPQTFVNQTCGSIFTALFNSVPSEGVTLGTVDPGPTVARLIFNRQHLTDCFDQVATIAGYIWSVNPNTGQLFFQSPTDPALVAPAQLTGDPSTGFDIKYDTIQWTIGNLDFVTTQHVAINITAFALETDFITGDGSSTSFTLPFEIDTVTQIVLLAGPAQSVATSSLGDLNNGGVITVAGQSATLHTTYAGTSGIVEIKLAGNLDQTLQNIADWINAAAVSGTNYQVNSGATPPPNPNVSATATGAFLMITAKTPGTSGNTLAWGDGVLATGLAFTGPSAGTGMVHLTGGSDGPTRAMGTATFSRNPADGDTITIDNISYTFKTTIDNQVSYQVKLGLGTVNTIGNLAAAMRGAPYGIGIDGIDFSYPSFPHPSVVSSPGSSSITFFAKTPGAAGNSIAISKVSAFITLSGSTLSGAVDGPTSVQNIAQVGSQATADWFWQQGDSVVTASAAPASGLIFAVTYYRLGQDVITVENTALAQLRAAVEGGSGIYQALQAVTDSTNPVSNNPKSALEYAQSLLRTYSILPETLQFETEVPGLQTGQTVTLNLPSGNPFSPLNGTYSVEQINANYIAGMPGWRYTVQCTAISGSPPAAIPKIHSAIEVFEKMATVQRITQRPAPHAVASTTAASGGGGGTGGTGAKNTIQPVALVAGNNAVSPSPSASSTGDFLTVVATQPAGGGGWITWSSAFIGISSSDINPLTGARNRYLFYWDGTHWDNLSRQLGT